MPHRAEPVRHRQRRAVRRGLVQRLLHETLALGVQRGCGLVEEQQARVADEGAGDGDALPLTAGELETLGSAGRVEAVREGGHEFECGSLTARLEDLVVGGLVLQTERDVLTDGAVVQGRVLLHERHVVAVQARRHAGDVLAAEGDASRGGIVEALEEGDERALAAAGWTDTSSVGAWGNLQEMNVS